MSEVPENPPKIKRKGPQEQVLPEHFAQVGLDLYLKGNTLQEVADAFKVPFTAVARISRRDHWTDKKRFTGKVNDKLSADSVEHLWRKKNDYVKLAIRDLVSQGKRVKTAAELFGWSLADIKEWLKEDEDFKRRIAQAVAVFECKLTTDLNDYQGRDWKPKQFLLATHEELKDVYKDQDDKNKGTTVVVNLERPALGEMPVITMHRGEVIDVEPIAPLLIEDVKTLEKPLSTRVKPAKSPEMIAQERTDAHNRAIQTRRKEQRKDWWKKQESQNG